MSDKKFYLYWLHGVKELVTGETITEAINKKYSAGALRALDFYSEKDNYSWDSDKKEWTKKEEH